ncbi:MAG: phosphoglycerate kinase, partial [Mycobacteriales bacterium]
MRSATDLDVSGKRVLVRCDLNVPLKDGAISDDGRIRASLPLLQDLTSRGARVIVLAHLGRPKGEPDPALSLRPVYERLQELLPEHRVRGSHEVVGEHAAHLVDVTKPGDIGLLENIRFDPLETSKVDAERAALAAELAAFADLYVDDAFGAVHRKHASV